MKKLIVAVALIAAAPAFAQNPLTTTQNPPAGSSSQSSPNTANSLPQAAGTEPTTQQPGSAVGTTQTQTTAPATGAEAPRTTR